MGAPLSFKIEARAGEARAGRLVTPHGTVHTPAFMPVATYGTVRGVSGADLRALGAEIVLANTYHLDERPGAEVIAAAGGLHGFTAWRGPWLTDSGGFQVTSLAQRAQVAEHGVTFHSALDGQRRTLTPERAVAIQEALGADIAMALDECLPADPSEGERMREAMERSLRWAERCRRVHSRPDQALFGIVQGGTQPALRRSSAQQTAAQGFDGYAHGGLGLGEPLEQRDALLALTHACLPEDRPRYLMGLGRPEDLVRGVARGVDLFDCVVPTRHGRHGVLFTSEGQLRVKHRCFERDFRPPDPHCDCVVCTQHSRSYLRHLLRSGEALGARLASLHNLRFYLRTLERVREAISVGTFRALHDEVIASSRVRLG